MKAVDRDICFNVSMLLVGHCQSKNASLKLPSWRQSAVEEEVNCLVMHCAAVVTVGRWGGRDSWPFDSLNARGVMNVFCHALAELAGRN